MTRILSCVACLAALFVAQLVPMSNARAADPSTPAAAASPTTEPTTVPDLSPKAPEPPAHWEVFKADEFTIATPPNWRKSAQGGHTLFALVGDGRGVPALDEKLQPLEVRLLIERYTNVKQAPRDGINTFVRNLRTDVRLRVLGEPDVQEVKLADGTDAACATVRVIREESRGKMTLSYRLLAVDKNATGFSVNGMITASADSKINQPDSDVAKFLKAHIMSFVFDPTKLDEKPLADAYAAYTVAFKRTFDAGNK